MQQQQQQHQRNQARTMRKVPLFIFSFLVFCLTPSALAVSDPYTLLGVLPDCSDEVIDRAFRRIKLRIDPHRHGNSPEAKERLQELQSAYDNLKNPDFRIRYNIHLRESENPFPEEPNLYKVLGVLSDSSPPELTRAYRELRGRIHPDRFGGDNRLANERTKSVQQAHKTLLDPLLRARHDEILKGAGQTLTHSPAEKKPSKAKTEPEQQAEGGFAFSQDWPKPAPARDPSVDTAQTEAWYEQVFDLARELEKAGREEDYKEAIDWYRLLAQEKNHPEATLRLASLLEKFDMKEALYRYERAENMSADPALKREAVFRQALIYQTGFSQGNTEIIPKDPEKAEELFRRAHRMGTAREDIAGWYERSEDYETARKWLAFSDPYLRTNSSHLQTASENSKGNRPLHEAVLAATIYGEEKSLQMIKTILPNTADINATDPRGQTSLHLAAKNLWPDTVRILLRAGADPDIPDQNGIFPLSVFPPEEFKYSWRSWPSPKTPWASPFPKRPSEP